ncbi:uncharacterized protein LOC141618809 [Silene latifolia]|uniref:uncharacterized protein LOC141618809 n=1 Tax=Silene latifolia TaxID=37657 RepID=UPI003D76E9FE
MARTNTKPWFADFANYIVGRVLPPNLNYNQRKRFLFEVKMYFWDDPNLYKACSDGFTRSLCHNGKFKMFWKVATHPHMEDTMELEGRLLKSYKWASIGPPCLKMLESLSFKWVEAIAIPTDDAKTVAKLLRKVVFPRFEVPSAIISDGGTHFHEKKLAYLLTKYGV